MGIDGSQMLQFWEIRCQSRFQYVFIFQTIEAINPKNSFWQSRMFELAFLS